MARKKKCVLSEQALRSSLITMVEFGYKCCERGMNIQATIAGAELTVDEFVGQFDLPKELFRFSVKGDKLQAEKIR